MTADAARSDAHAYVSPVRTTPAIAAARTTIIETMASDEYLS
jgi:hypothetical protein